MPQTSNLRTLTASAAILATLAGTGAAVPEAASVGDGGDVGTALRRVPAPSMPLGISVPPSRYQDVRGATFPAERLAVDHNCADPSVTPDPAHSRYLLVCTGGRMPTVPLRASRDLIHWHLIRKALITRAHPMPWAHMSYWGPTLAEFGGEWHMYITGADSKGRLRIGEGVAKQATGPYTFENHPIVATPGSRDIDPSVFAGKNGAEYLVYKTANLSNGGDTKIWIARLSVSGRAIGHARMLLHADRPREHGVVEAPVLVREHGQLDLYYSMGSYRNPDYAIGVARAHSLHGPFVKHDGPIMETRGKWNGPGGESPVIGPGGVPVMVWHAFPGPVYHGVRDVLVGRRGFAHGWPTMPADRGVG